MSTVFSHIVQKRLSAENENVATEALSYILNSSEAARNGVMKLLRGIAPKMPQLQFRTQQAKDDARPDMQGCDDDGKVRLLVENKFWAGLTDNQPVSYLRQLAENGEPTLLLIVGPEARRDTLWREMKQRLAVAEIIERGVSEEGIFRTITTGIGPILALTSWRSLLGALETEVADDKRVKGDIEQLKALCDAADSDAFFPISSETGTDQRIPSLILQLNSVLQSAVDLAVTEGALHIGDLRPQNYPSRSGRYVYLGNDKSDFDPWLGIHYILWKKHGRTPFWVLFYRDWGRAVEVRKLLEPWAIKNRIFTTTFVETDGGECFAIAVDIPFGEGKDQVIRTIVDHLKEMADKLSSLKSRPAEEAK